MAPSYCSHVSILFIFATLGFCFWSIFTSSRWKQGLRVKLVCPASTGMMATLGQGGVHPINGFTECTANLKIWSTYRSSVPQPSGFHRCCHSSLERIQNQTKPYQDVLTERKALGRMVSDVDKRQRKNGREHLLTNFRDFKRGWVNYQFSKTSALHSNHKVVCDIAP